MTCKGQAVFLQLCAVETFVKYCAQFWLLPFVFFFKF